jgi:hypothetical protein
MTFKESGPSRRTGDAAAFLPNISSRPVAKGETEE